MNINVDLMSVVYAFLTLGVYTTVVCVFFYLRSEKSIEQNEAHWREMFMHMSGRLDKVVEKK